MEHLYIYIYINTYIYTFIYNYMYVQESLKFKFRIKHWFISVNASIRWPKTQTD